MGEQNDNLLGAHVRTFSGQPLALRLLVVTLIAMVELLWVGCVLGLTVNAFAMLKRAEGFDPGAMLGCLFLILTSLPIIFFIQHGRILARWVTNPSVELFENGITVRSLGGGSRSVLLTEIAAVTSLSRRIDVRSMGQTVSSATQHAFRLRLRDGTLIHLPQTIRDIAVLGGLLVRQSLAHLAPEVARRLTAGETVSFGDITVGPLDLTVGKKRFSRAEIDGISVEAGLLELRAHGIMRASVWCHKVENLELLLQTLERSTID